jgi:hypothetical protein
MASTTFVSGTTIASTWLNDVNSYVYGAAAGTRQQGTVTATSGQTVFTVPFTYTPASKRLDVFINGVKQRITSSYAETNSTTVTFTEAVPVTAVVEFVY